MAAIVQAQCAARIAPAASSKATGRVSLKAGFSGQAVQAHTHASVSLGSARRSLAVKAADAPAAPAKKEEEKPWTAPKLNPNTPSPIFGGSTGGLLRKAQVRS
jgi:photosystem I subunit 2